MRNQKRRRVAARGADASEPAPESTARWGELPREIVAMIASYTCDPAQPLPCTQLSYVADPDSGAYPRQEDRSLVASGSQLTCGQGYPTGQPTGAGPTGQSASNPADAAAASGDAGDAGAGVPAAIPGTFRPCRMNDTALAMRRVCRLWCEVLSEGLRVVTLYGNRDVTLWASHFPLLSTLRLESCCDLFVRSSSEGPDAHQRQQQRRGRSRGDGGDGGSDDTAGPGPSSAAAAAAASAAAATSRGRRRGPRSGAAAGRTARGGGDGGPSAAAAASGSSRSRSLAAMTSLRNLQISDTALQLDLAASCPSLEELVVRAQQQTQQYGTYRGRDVYGGYGGPMSPGAGRRGSAGRCGPGGSGGAGAAQAVSRRSALDRALSSLPGLRRLRLSGLDASAARLGSTLMALTGLTSLRLYQCRVPTFIGSPERARAGHSSFGRELVMNLGAKLQDLALRGCSLKVLPNEVLAGLTGLRILDLSNNWLHALPPTVTLMTRLEYLDLQHNALGSLPPGMGALSRLVDLDLSGNYLHRLPFDFSELTSLTFLNLGGLHGLDMGICWRLLATLTNLQCLGLSDVDLSEDVGNPDAVHPALAAQHPPPPQQQQQGAWQGPLHALISALAPAGRLRELTLDGCGLNNLPASFSDLTALSHLSLMENFDASGLPEAISSLRNLAVLGLGYLDLRAPLPDSLYDMASLRVLDLQQNYLPALSPDVSKLSNLQVLNLLDAVDPLAERDAIPWVSIYRLTRLRHLSVAGHDAVPQLPPGIRALASLEILQLTNVHVVSAVLDELCTHVRGLTCLELVQCDISSLPAAMTRLSRLTDLQLTENRLVRLPAGFGALTRLMDLGLSGNDGLRSLPDDITRLTGLRNLSWSVDSCTTAPPSAEQLAWMAGLPCLALDGVHNFAELAKSYKIAWSTNTVGWD